eukprot:COSAG06_NODE_46521_length_346_cov_0.825911_1_plen_47_part_10
MTLVVAAVSASRRRHPQVLPIDLSRERLLSAGARVEMSERPTEKTAS